MNQLKPVMIVAMLSEDIKPVILLLLLLPGNKFWLKKGLPCKELIDNNFYIIFIDIFNFIYNTNHKTTPLNTNLFHNA